MWYANFKLKRKTHTIIVRKHSPWDKNYDFIVEVYDKRLYKGGNALVYAVCRTTPDDLECVHWYKYYNHSSGNKASVKWTFKGAMREMPEIMGHAELFIRDETTSTLLRML